MKSIFSAISFSLFLLVSGQANASKPADFVEHARPLVLRPSDRSLPKIELAGKCKFGESVAEGLCIPTKLGYQYISAHAVLSPDKQTLYYYPGHWALRRSLPVQMPHVQVALNQIEPNDAMNYGALDAIIASLNPPSLTKSAANEQLVAQAD